MGSYMSQNGSLSARVSPSSLSCSSSGHPVTSASARSSSPENEPNLAPTETKFSAAVRATSLAGAPRCSYQPGANSRPTNATYSSTAKSCAFT